LLLRKKINCLSNVLVCEEQVEVIFKTISIKNYWWKDKYIYTYKFSKRQLLHVTHTVMKSFKMNSWERKYEMYCILIIIIIMYLILTRILIILEYHIYHNILTPNLTCIKTVIVCFCRLPGMLVQILFTCTCG